jgi:hypothetical protein
MARQVITTLIDDRDSGTAEETVKFAFDGAAYEIDLSGKNALKFRKAVEPYITAGTKVGRGGLVRGPARGSSAASREENAAIRAWAKAQARTSATAG